MIAVHQDGTVCADASLCRRECPRNHDYAPAWVVSWRAWFGGECRATLDSVNVQGIHLTSSDGFTEYCPTGYATTVDRLLSGISVVEAVR